MTELKTKIDAQQVLKDIRSGMGTSELMRKYGLTEKGLRSLFKKLVEGGLVKRSAVQPGFKPEVKAKEVAKDILSGMSRAELGKKYRLSERGLNSLLSKLRGAGIVSDSDAERLTQPTVATSTLNLSDLDDWLIKLGEAPD